MLAPPGFSCIFYGFIKAHAVALFSSCLIHLNTNSLLSTALHYRESANGRSFSIGLARECKTKNQSLHYDYSLRNAV